MARPIPFDPSSRDPREELRSRLQDAPVEHAEALLATYEILQGLHDRGVLNLLRGVVGSSHKVMGTVVEAIKTPEAVRVSRNLLLLIQTLGAIEPDSLRVVAHTFSEVLRQTKAQEQEAPGLWELFNRIRSNDGRRGLAAFITALETLGRNTSADKPV
jgi:uncharacterized protein YjgD (DUF1641 family)